MGMILKKQLMQGHAVIATNLPCDTHLCTNTLLESEIDTPFFRLDAPYNFTTDRAADYFAGELKGMISWLESVTGHDMDWEKLRQICNVRNRWVELQSEYWETLRVKPAPMAGEAVFLPNWFAGILQPGSKRNIRMFEKLFALSRRNLEQKIAAVPNEKFRVLIWNMPIVHFFEVFSWAEETWGVSVIAESLAFNRIPYIDTETKENMLRGIAKLILYAPMARHSRGPAENYMDDMFFAHKTYNTDMIWVGSNIGCKKTMALTGMLRERCREAGIPILNINMEILDPRAINHEMIKEQINQFMENTMKARRFCNNQKGKRRNNEIHGK
jgi:benzoyl-CoA reductase/2-hydroxyglutaryl-CoA dehydratase subunit BcrC/BadD/HgdB